MKRSIPAFVQSIVAKIRATVKHIARCAVCMLIFSRKFVSDSNMDFSGLLYAVAQLDRERKLLRCGKKLWKCNWVVFSPLQRKKTMHPISTVAFVHEAEREYPPFFSHRENSNFFKRYAQWLIHRQKMSEKATKKANEHAQNVVRVSVVGEKKKLLSFFFYAFREKVRGHLAHLFSYFYIVNISRLNMHMESLLFYFQSLQL